MAYGSCQSAFDQYDLYSNDYEYLMFNNVSKMTPGRSDHLAFIFDANKLHLSSPPEPPKNWGQIKPNLNDCHSDTIEISSTFGMPDIPNWWP
jgi:hypothetical protein